MALPQTGKRQGFARSYICGRIRRIWQGFWGSFAVGYLVNEKTRIGFSSPQPELFPRGLMGSASPGQGREMATESRANGKSPSPDLVLTELDRILESASFRGSPPLSRFLRYTVEHSLHGEGGRLKEYRLGLEVFGRCSSYEPQKDPIVRLEARRLRAKLREYYEDEGRHDPVRIDVPKG